MIRALESRNFPPFGPFLMEFPEVPDKPAELGEVHLLTGINGTGKTRLLAVLAAMLGNPSHFRQRAKLLEAPVRFRVDDSSATNRAEKAGSQIGNPDNMPVVGGIHLFNAICHIGSDGRSNVFGSGKFVSWTSEVPAFAYSGLAYVVDAPITVMGEVRRPQREDCLAFSRPPDQSRELLQAIANVKVQAAMDYMNVADRPGNSTRALTIVRKLESAISEVTGQPFTFQVTSYPKATLEVAWGRAQLPFDLLPDGLRSIIGWLAQAVVMMDAWVQGKGDLTQTEAVFLLDEIESHLHPAWQRKILPAFQRLFPKAQIFVATHSPFVIASLNHGWIHKLVLEKDGHVKVDPPRAASQGDSYISVVEDIMGIQEWFDPETEQLLASFRSKREAAYQGDLNAQVEARQLAASIGSRSMELEYMMGRELSQMGRQLAQTVAAK
jgi:energy-coupling factor transporter ATP-binding protein EcfA2